MTGDNIHSLFAPLRWSLRHALRQPHDLSPLRLGGSCGKRFSRGDDATLHCPDFSEDVTLRRCGEEPPATPTHPARKD
jgi:hypothetical protein